jgi:hypothetical protein
MAVANTSVTFAGRAWAMVMLPLPSDRKRAVQLLIHEAWHAAQDRVLPLARADETGAGSELLERPDGRIWLVLEWRALAAALRDQGDSQRQDVQAALAFRARRHLAAAPEERRRERLLDLSEGMAEYTAWKLGDGTAAELTALLTAEAPGAASYVRSFPYADGPAYGFLLDARAPGWTRRLRDTPDAQRLLAATLPNARDLVAALDVEAPRAQIIERAERAAGPRGLDEIRRREETRWSAHQTELARLRALFVDGPTLRIRTGALQLSFDPRSQVSLGDAGTVMSNLRWTGEHGAELTAPSGGLVDKDWSELRVPLGGIHLTEGSLAAPTSWSGPGWRLALPSGWRLRRTDASWVATPR